MILETPFITKHVRDIKIDGKSLLYNFLGDYNHTINSVGCLGNVTHRID